MQKQNRTSCIVTQVKANFCPKTGSGTVLVKDSSATDSKASVGHGKNQSIVQQLTKDGNIRHLRLIKTRKNII